MKRMIPPLCILILLLSAPCLLIPGDAQGASDFFCSVCGDTPAEIIWTSHAQCCSHGVMIPGTTILAGTGSEEGAVTTTTPFGVELQQAADKVTATITDKNGAVVRTIDIGELTAGVHSFTWDGTLTDGSTAPNGSYNVAISASNGGTQLVAQPLQFALVQGVIRGNSGNTLDLGTYGTTTLDEVRQII